LRIALTALPGRRCGCIRRRPGGLWSLDTIVELDQPVTLADFPEHDRRRPIYLYDLGPGTEIRLPSSVASD